MASKAINIINVPSDLGSIYAGKSKAPEAFKTAGLHEGLQAAGFNVQEFTAFEKAQWVASTREPNGGRNEASIVEACEKVEQTVATALSSEGSDPNKPLASFQLILSGECLYCPPIMSAYWKHLEGSDKRIGIIYVDADCDLETATDANSTGNIAGMTLTHLVLSDGALDSMKAFCRPNSNRSGVVDSSNIVLFGLNINSPTNKLPQLGYLFDYEFRVLTSHTIQQAPVERAKEALRWIEERVDYVLVHLDVDVIDPAQFPLANVPNRTGIGFKEAMAAVKTFLRSEKVVGFSVAEVNPDHDPELGMTKQLVSEIIQGLAERSNL